MAEKRAGIALHPWYRRHFPRGLLRKLSRSGFEIRHKHLKYYFRSPKVWLILPKRQRSFKRAQRPIVWKELSARAPRKNV
jgi:hypothetical protein